MPSIDTLGSDYRNQIDKRLNELRNQYGLVFKAIFDPSVGAFILTSDRVGAHQEYFYPTNNTNTIYPQFSNLLVNVVPSLPTVSPPEGFGILRIEHIGLPNGYYPITNIKGVYGTSPTVNPSSFSALLNSSYPQNVINLVTANSGLPYHTFANQEVIQLQLPMGGPLQFGYRIDVTEILGTPYGDFASNIHAWGGTASGDHILFNPSPGQLHTIRIPWSGISQTARSIQFPIAAPPTNVPISPPVVLPTAPAIPPIVQEEIDKNTNITTGINNTVAVQPQFIPSTLPQTSEPPPFSNPYVHLTPHVDPENTFRASTTDEMYSFSPSVFDYKWVYDVGKAPNITPITYKFRNNTVNTTLHFQFDIPSWVIMSTSKVFNMEPQTNHSIIFSFDEENAKTKSILKEKKFNELLQWVVTPQNITGPVFISKELPPLITSNPPTIQTPEITTIPDPLTVQTTEGMQLIDEMTSVIYLKITPSRIVVDRGSSLPIKLEAWIGPDGVEPSVTNYKELVFPKNGIKWYSSNDALAMVESINASNHANLIAYNNGVTEIVAEILSSPTNISAYAWQTAMKNKVAGTNIFFQNNAITVVAIATVVTNLNV